MKEFETTNEDTKGDAAEAASGTKLHRRNTRAENLDVVKECVKRNSHFKKMRESIQKRMGFDIADEKKFPVASRSFSWPKFVDKLREAEHSSGHVELLRAGVQTAVNSLYQTVETTFEDWAHVIQSSRMTELYAPLQGIGFPQEVPEEGLYPEAKALGLDMKLKNRKYGEIFPVTKELLEDDQTGQFYNQVSLMAEYLKQVLEVLAYGKLNSVAAQQYAGLRVPTSETKPSDEANYPYAAASAPFIGGGYNRPAAFGVLSQANIQNGIIALAGQKNKLGLTMSVAPSRLLASHFYRFDAAVLLNSGYYPSGAAAAGSVGGAFAINPIQGVLDATYSRFMFDNAGAATALSKAWYIVDDSKPFFVVQIREAASITQENPDAGESFSRDVQRFKAKTRCNADFIDPRFVWRGSDGSV